MADVATISLKVETSSLERGEQKLKTFSDTAESTAKAVDGLSNEIKKSASSNNAASQAYENLSKTQKDVLSTETRLQNKYATNANLFREQIKNIELTAGAGTKLREVLSSVANSYNERKIDRPKFDVIKTSLESMIKLADEASDKVGQSFLRQVNTIERSAGSISALRGVQESLNTAYRSGNIDTAKYDEVLSSITQKTKELARVEQIQSIAKDAMLNKLQEQSFLYGASKTDIMAYRAAQLGISKDAAPIINAIKQQEERTARLAQEQRNAADAARQLAAEQRQAAMQAARDQKEKDNFIQSLKAQSDAVGKTKSEILELKAAHLGLTQQAAPMIAKLKEQEKAFMNGSMTIGQYRNAMRQLPMQMTDIVTSLASGMPIWMIMVQQGGQIKDSFGGIGNTFKAITSLITPMRIAMLGGSTALGALAVAAYQGSQEFSEFNKQLILTGNYAGRTGGQLQMLARQMSGNGITQGGMANALAKTVGSGSFSGSAVEMVANTAAKMEQAVGKSVDETIKQFERIKDDPVKAINELDKSLHFLTASQLEQITTLEQQGKTTEAATLAMEVYSKAMNDRMGDIRENLGWLETAWDGVKNGAAKAWDAMLDVGREKSVELQIADVEEALKRMSDNPWSNNSIVNSEHLKSKLAGLKAQKQLKDGVQSIQKIFLDAREEEKRQFNIDVKLNREMESEEQRHQNELTKIRNSGASKDVIERRIKFEEDEYRKRQEKKQNKGSREKTYRPDLGTRWEEESQARNRALQAELKTLQDESKYVGVISQQRRELFKTENQLAILEEARSGSNKRRLSDDEKSLLLRKDAILAEKREAADIGDKIEKQKQLNALRLSNDGLEEELRLRQESIGKTDIQLAKERELKKYRDDMKRRGVSKDEPEYGRGILLIEEKYDKEENLRKSWEDGVKEGYKNFEKVAGNAYENVGQMTQTVFQSMSNTMSNFLLTGKNDFESFTKSVLEMIVKIMMQMALMNAMRTAFTGNAVGNFLGFAEGGHTGHGNKYDVAGVVHKDEFVFTKEATQRIGVANLYNLMNAGKRGYATGGHVGGSQPLAITSSTPKMYGLQPTGASNVQVNLGGISVDNQGQQQSNTSNIDARAAEQSLTNKIKQLLIKEGRDGGDLFRIIKDVSRS